MVMNDRVNTIQKPLYDTYTASAAAATTDPIFFFKDPISSAKGRNRTNLTSPAKLEGKAFLINAIRVWFGPNMGKVDIGKFYENYVLRLLVSDKEVNMGGIEWYPAGCGLVADVATNDATTTKMENYQNGKQDPNAINVLDTPITVGQGEQFHVELVGTVFTLAAAAFVRVYLDTMIQEPIAV